MAMETPVWGWVKTHHLPTFGGKEDPFTSIHQQGARVLTRQPWALPSGDGGTKVKSIGRAAVKTLKAWYLEIAITMSVGPSRNFM